MTQIPRRYRRVGGRENWQFFMVNTKRSLMSTQVFLLVAAHENEPRLAVPSCHGR